MKLKLPRRPVWRVVTYIVSILLVVLAVDLVLVRMGRHVTPGYTTTRITSPLAADGRIDYLTALENYFGQGVTSENNGAPLVLAALGPDALPRNQPKDGITARLGMPPLAEKGEYFQERRDYFEKPDADESNPANDLNPLLKHPWKAAEHPRTAAWLAANEKPLAMLAEASKRPKFYLPFNGGTPPELMIDIQLPHLRLMRDAGRALTCRAMMKAGAGDWTGARQDLVTVHEFARLLGGGATLIDRLVGDAIDNMANSATAALAIEGKLDAEEARRWIAAMREIPPVSNFDSVVDVGERYFFLDLVQYASRHGMYQMRVRIDDIMRESARHFGAESTVARPHWYHALQSVKLSSVMEDANHWFDRFAEAVKKPAGAERREALEEINKEFQKVEHAGEPWQSMQSWGWPALIKSTQALDGTQARRNLAMIAMALAAHRAEHGEYPAGLDAVVSADLAGSLVDPFSAKQLMYRPAPGGYTLYSVGPNLSDDQGLGDDIVIGTGRKD